MLNNAGINSQEASALIIVTQHYDTLQSLASRMAYDDDKMARFLTLNQLGANARLKASDRVKLVILR